MNIIFYLVSPLALLLPAVAQGPAASHASDEAIARAVPETPQPETGLQSDEAIAPLRVLEEARQLPPQHQVRIERRVIIRISPGTADQRSQLPAALQRQRSETSYEEMPHGNCVAVGDIAGVQTMRDRLLLIMRDRKMLSATLERSCDARAFYSGFYVERNDDGQLCVARDRLQSRSGAVCQIDSLHRMVATRN